jgi:thiol-disulfide isomerase/thioredoxin
MSRDRYIDEQFGHIPEDYEPAKGSKRPKMRCTNKVHYQPSGWCPTCDSEWDDTTLPTEEEIAEVASNQIRKWKEELAAARRRLAELNAAERTGEVLLARVDAKDIINKRLEDLAAADLVDNPPWRIGGNMPRDRE